MGRSCGQEWGFLRRIWVCRAATLRTGVGARPLARAMFGSEVRRTLAPSGSASWSCPAIPLLYPFVNLQGEATMDTRVHPGASQL
jgi:hypothetical protein